MRTYPTNQPQSSRKPFQGLRIPFQTLWDTVYAHLSYLELTSSFGSWFETELINGLISVPDCFLYIPIAYHILIKSSFKTNYNFEMTHLFWERWKENKELDLENFDVITGFSYMLFFLLWPRTKVYNRKEPTQERNLKRASMGQW